MILFNDVSHSDYRALNRGMKMDIDVAWLKVL
jgi:hypothetical protein